MSSWAPIVFGSQAPDTGNAEIIAHYGTDAQKERVPAAAARRGDLLLLLDDRAPGRLGPRRCSTRADRDGDEWVHQRVEVLLLQRPHGRVPHRHGRDQPRRVGLRGQSMFLVPTDTPGVDIVRDVGLGRRARGARLARPHPLRRRAGPGRGAARAGRARRSPSPRPGSAGAASTTPCAPSAWPRRPSTCMCERALSRQDPGRTAGRQAVRPGLHRRLLRRADAVPAAACCTRRG